MLFCQPSRKPLDCSSSLYLQYNFRAGSSSKAVRECQPALRAASRPPTPPKHPSKLT
jgi:hypothetical protein